MKKTLLSLFVIFTFGFYAISQRQTDALSVAGLNNPSVTTVNSPVATNTPTHVASPDVVATTAPAPVVNTPKPVVKTNPTPTPAPTPASAPTPVPVPAPVAVKPKGQYKDGTYTGNLVDAYYGNVQVAAVISGGKLVDINILDYPQDRNTSRSINSQAIPMLKAEAIQAQSAAIDGVSGASATSPAFIQSLGSALAMAKN